MIITPEQHDHAKKMIDFIDQSPSPWHAVRSIATRLEKAGYQELDESLPWHIVPGGNYFVIRGHSSLIAIKAGTEAPEETGFRIIGAHTDSPTLRVKPKAAICSDQMLRLGVDVYGGPILATFTDRDLSFAGQISVRTAHGIKTSLVCFERPLVRLPNLAIHLNRKVNEDGLKLQRQSELPLILQSLEKNMPSSDQFLELLSQKANCSKEDILSFELNVYDTQKGCLWGPSEEFLADSQIDNLASCFSGMNAMRSSIESAHTSLCAFFDHEEIGSESYKGADGSFLSDTLERIHLGLTTKSDVHKIALAKSFLISADAAHAYHPNFSGSYDPQHSVRINEGPALKINPNQRYATDGQSEARFKELCREAQVPCQTYVHRSDLSCGSTIGPMTSARLGISTVDCGAPMWAMHSLRESAGVLDQLWLTQTLSTFLGMTKLP